MMHMEVDASGVQAYLDGLASAGKSIKAAKAGMFGQASGDIKAQVDSAVGASNPDINGDTVQGWQGAYVGSRGGYAAVRARSGEFKVQGSKRYAVGYLTNTLENGGKARLPSGRDPYYRPRIEWGRIRPRGFYKRAGAQFKTPAAVQQFVDRVVSILKGGG